MDVLKDESLEQLGLIKEIDTLQILREAQAHKARQDKLAIQLLIGFMFIICAIAQVILFKLMGINSLLFIVAGAYVLLACVMMLMLVMKGER